MYKNKLAEINLRLDLLRKEKYSSEATDRTRQIETEIAVLDLQRDHIYIKMEFVKTIYGWFVIVCGLLFISWFVLLFYTYMTNPEIQNNPGFSFKIKWSIPTSKLLFDTAQNNHPLIYSVTLLAFLVGIIWMWGVPVIYKFLFGKKLD